MSCCSSVVPRVNCYRRGQGSGLGVQRATVWEQLTGSGWTHKATERGDQAPISDDLNLFEYHCIALQSYLMFIIAFIIKKLQAYGFIRIRHPGTE